MKKLDSDLEKKDDLILNNNKISLNSQPEIHPSNIDQNNSKNTNINKIEGEDLMNEVLYFSINQESK